METRTEIKQALRGGKGRVIFRHILSDREMRGKCRMYAQLTLEPGSSIGYHVHQGESETFYILSGNGTFNDNGAIKDIRPGDVTHTASGSGHSLENTGSGELTLMALIILD